LSLELLARSFNPRPRAGGDFEGRRVWGRFNLVSIHAPARGATEALREVEEAQNVSIHAPARGATLAPTAAPLGIQCFNPRPRAGGDWQPPGVLLHTFCFNPRPRAGGDFGDRTTWDGAGMFQSTPPRGGRRALSQHPLFPYPVSIHAPARGATKGFPSSSTPPKSFNPRPRAGGDTVFMLLANAESCFNPRPRAGGDTRSENVRGLRIAFQSTPPRGGRLQHP